MEGAEEVGRAFIRIVGDDDDFWRDLRRLEHARVRDVTVGVDLDSAEARREIEALQHTHGGEITFGADINTSEFLRELATLIAAIKAVPKEIDVDVDTDKIRAGTTGMAAFGLASRTARGSISDFNTAVKTGTNFMHVAMIPILIAAVAALAPLTALLGIAASGFAAVAAGVGLLAQPILAVTKNLTEHEDAVEGVKTAQDAARSATESYADAKRSLADATRTASEQERSAAQAIGDSRRSLEEAYTDLSRTRQDTAEQVADAERSVGEAVRSAGEQVAAARQTHSDAVRSYEDAIRQAREDEKSATEALRDSERNLADAVTEARQREQEALRGVAEARQSLSEAVKQAAELEKDALEGLKDAQEAYAEAVEAAREREKDALEAVRDAQRQLAEVIRSSEEAIAQARQAARDAAAQVREEEDQLKESREDVRDATIDLRQAEDDLRLARATEDERILLMEGRLAQQRAELTGITSEIAETEEALKRARESGAGDLFIGDLEQNLRELKADETTTRAEIRLARAELNQARRHGTEELQSAEERMAEALDQQREALEGVKDAQDELNDSRGEAVKALKDIAVAQREANRAEREARSAIRESMRSLAEIRVENAESIRDAQAAITEAHAALRDAQREGLQGIQEARQGLKEAGRALKEARTEGQRSIREAQKEVRDSAHALASARREGARSIAEAHRTMARAQRDVAKAQAEGARQIASARRDLARAERDRQRAIADARRAIQDARRDVNRAQADYQKAQADGARMIAEAQRAVHRAAREMAKAQKDLDKALKEPGARLKDWEKDLLHAVKAFGRTWNREFRGARREVARTATEVVKFGEKAIPALGKASEKTASAMRRAFQHVMQIFSRHREINAFKKILNDVPPIMRDLTKAAGNAADGVLFIVKGSMPFVKDFARWLKRITKDFADWARSKEGRRDIRNFLRDGAEFARKMAPKIGEIVKDLFRISQNKEVKEFFWDLVNAFKWLVEHTEQVVNFFSRVEDFLNNMNRAISRRKPSEFWKKLGHQSGVNYIGGMRVGIHDSDPGIDKFSDDFKKKANDHFGIRSPSTWFAGVGRMLIQGLSGGMKAEGPNASNQARAVGTGAKNAIASAANLVQSGKNAILGFIAGIKSQAGNLYEAAKNLMEGFVAKVKEHMGEDSPSKVMRERGRNTVRGYILGIEDEIASVHSAAVRMAAAADVRIPARGYRGMGGAWGAGLGHSGAGQSIRYGDVHMPLNLSMHQGASLSQQEAIALAAVRRHFRQIRGSAATSTPSHGGMA